MLKKLWLQYPGRLVNFYQFRYHIPSATGRWYLEDSGHKATYILEDFVRQRLAFSFRSSSHPLAAFAKWVELSTPLSDLSCSVISM